MSHILILTTGHSVARLCTRLCTTTIRAVIGTGVLTGSCSGLYSLARCTASSPQRPVVPKFISRYKFPQKILQVYILSKAQTDIFLQVRRSKRSMERYCIVLTLAFTPATVCCHIAIISTHTFIVSKCVVADYIGLLETAVSRRICTLVDI